MAGDSSKAPQPAPSDLSSSTGVGAGADMAATDISRVTERTDKTDRTDRTDRTDKSSYSIPEDGTPVTIPTNRRRKDADSTLSRDAHQSQTSLLIEYFGGGKGSTAETPSVRVKVTPSSKSRSKSSGGHIQITKTRSGDGERSSRRAASSSYSKRIHLDKKSDRIADLDGQSVSSYASQTEESNVSRNPNDEVRPPRRHGSPLIPNSDAPSQVVGGSDVSSMPANSFLDGESSINSREKTKSRGYSRGDALIQGAAAGATRAVVSDALKPQRRRSRSLSRERRKSEKSSSDKKRISKSEHRSKHEDGTRSRSVSDSKKRSSSSKNDDKYYVSERRTSPRRSSRSSRYKEESLVSGVSGVSAADSSVLSSKVSDRTYKSGTSAASKSSIGNPKLLEAVEDAIRRLILPELNAMRADSVRRDKKEAERKGASRSRRSSINSGTGSALSTETREVESRSKRTSAGDYSVKSKSTTVEDRPRSVSSGKIKLQKRDVDRTHSESPRTPTAKMPGGFDRSYSEDTVTREGSGGKRSAEKEKRSTLGVIGAAIGLGGLGYAMKDHADSKETLDQKERDDRRRRRARSRSRSDGGSLAESYESHHEEVRDVPRMPMMSDINASEITRSSILSADTDRPHTSGGESARTPVKEVSRGFVSTESPGSQTPTKSPYNSTRNLGTYHANVSTPNLSQTNLQRHQQGYELNEQGQKVPMNRDTDERHYENEYYEGEQQGKGKSIAAKLAGAAATVLAKSGITHQDSHDPYEQESEEEEIHSYNSQHVPAPLKYVPYNQEKRGLSPIQSVSGYTEADEQERLQKHRDSRASYGMQSKGSYSTLSNSPQKHQKNDSYDSQMSDTRNYDFKEVRQGGLTDSEISNDPDQLYWEEQHRINERNRELDALSYQSSDPRLDKHRSGFTEESNWQENSELSENQNYGGVGGKAGYVNTPVGVESAVASLLDASVLTSNTGGTRSPKPSPGLSPGGLSPRGMNRSPALRAAHSYDSRLSEQSGGRLAARRIASNASYDENSEANFTVTTPNPETQAKAGRRDFSWASEREGPLGGQSPGESPYEEYELDSQGRKINMPNYQAGTSKASVAETNQRNLSTQSPISTPGREFELDDHGRKVEMPNQNGTVSTKNAVLAGMVAGAAGATMVNRHQVPESSKSQDYFSQETYGQNTIPGAPLQKSFKDRAVDYMPPSPRHSEDRFTEDGESVKLTANALPNAHSPMPEFADDGSVTTNPRSINGAGEYRRYSDEMDWERQHQDKTPTQGDRTPTPGTPTRNTPIIGGGTPMSINRKPVGKSSLNSQQSDTALKAGQMGLMDGFSMGPSAGVAPNPAGPFKGHARDTSFEQNEHDWQRTSEDRKRDTLVTNPYENSSPVTLLGGERDRQVLGQLGYDGVKQNVGGALNYGATSPGSAPKDEGYISAPTGRSAGAITPEPRHRGVGFTDAAGMGPGEFDADPFYTPKHQRHASGMSQGMESPIYDSSMGTHRDAIKSRDIVALMDHLTVRDAQRNARDTEILVTLVRAAAEMRTSFEDMKRLLADTEDQVIMEVKSNTDKSVAKATIGLPRPLPQSVKSLRSGTGDDDDVPTQRRNVFRRALKGLRMKSGKELAQIEGMLVQLLGDVEGLKVAQGLSGGGMSSGHYDDYDSRSLEPVGDNHQEGGYEPDGHAGTTTASHASQSGHFSIPRANANASADKFGGRKFSENRISTVPEGDEDDELDHREQAVLDNAYHEDQVLTPVQRSESMPLESPPFKSGGLQTSQTFAISNDNTPKTDKSKKHKQSKSFTWNPLPKISRWSETTASTVADKFRSSGKVNDSRNNSDAALGRDSYDYDPHGEDKLGGFHSHDQSAGGPILTGGPARLDPHILENRNFDGGAYSPVSMMDEDRPRTAPSPGPQQPNYAQVKTEDPKYQAHRNSLNLQHPQPRPGQQYQSQLEREAIDYSGAKSPASMNWGSSQVSLPPNQNYRRYSAGTTGTEGSNFDGTYANDNTQGGLAPARPPKEPLDTSYGSGTATPTQRSQGKPTKPSPLVQNQTQNYETYSDEDDGTVSYDGSPRVANRAVPAGAYMSGGNNAAAGGAPVRKPTGPRQMGQPLRANATPKGQGELLKAEMERKRGKNSASPAMSEGSEGAGRAYQYW